MTTNTSTSPLVQLDALCEEYLVKKAPFAIPVNIKELIVKYGPYVSVVLAVLLLPVVLAAIGLTALLGPLSALSQEYINPLGTIWGILRLVFSLGGMLLWIMAIPGLFARSKKGWTYSFYNVLLNALQGLVFMQWGNLILGTLISLYVLYQIKSYYKN